MSEGLIDALCGGISGILTNFFTHPLDTVKVRLSNVNYTHYSAECRRISVVLRISLGC
jgi:hypothetical protein